VPQNDLVDVLQLREGELAGHGKRGQRGVFHLVAQPQRGRR
jgi:hypothetical protein